MATEGEVSIKSQILTLQQEIEEQVYETGKVFRVENDLPSKTILSLRMQEFRAMLSQRVFVLGLGNPEEDAKTIQNIRTKFDKLLEDLESMGNHTAHYQKEYAVLLKRSKSSKPSSAQG